MRLEKGIWFLFLLGSLSSSFSGLLLSRSGGTKGTWYFDGSNWLTTWVHDFHTIDRSNVTNPDRRTKLHLTDVEAQLIHEFLGSGFDLDAANVYLHLTTNTNTWAGSFKNDGNLYLDGVVGLKREEIDVAQFIRYGMKLVIFNDCLVALSSYGQICQLKLRRVNQRTDIEGLDSEVDRITFTVEYGGHKTFPTGSLAIFLS